MHQRGSGIFKISGFQVTNEMRAATLLKDWAENTTHPAVRAAALQMEAHLRNG